MTTLCPCRIQLPNAADLNTLTQFLQKPKKADELCTYANLSTVISLRLPISKLNDPILSSLKRHSILWLRKDYLCVIEQEFGVGENQQIEAQTGLTCCAEPQ